MNSKKTLNTLLAGAVAVAALGTVAATAQAGAGKEKCYGVVKAGKNGCAAANKSHGCAAQATIDGGGAEWLALPTGICEKLANGSLEPVLSNDEHEKSHEEHTEK